MIHSQSGAFAWPVADKRPDLVKMIVAVEPNGPPVREAQMVGAPDWFKDGTTDKLSGLGEVPLNYDPPLAGGAQLDFVRQEKADGPDMVRCWLQKEPARKLKNLANIPVVGDHVGGVLSRALRSLHRRLSAAGAACATDFIRLADYRHPRQRPHDDAREELRRHRARDGCSGSRGSSPPSAAAARARRSS